MELRNCYICEQNNTDSEPASRDQVIKTTKAMKNNKAANISGLTAAHKKFGDDVLNVNEVLSSGKIPDVFKQCVITPMYKKPRKPVHDPNSYRRVTITSIIDKLVKKYILIQFLKCWVKFKINIKEDFLLLRCSVLFTVESLSLFYPLFIS